MTSYILVLVSLKLVLEISIVGVLMNDELNQLVREACPDFCAALTHEEISKFIRYTSDRYIEPNDIIADMGDVSDSFFLVIEGGVCLFHADGEREFDVGTVEAGNLAGAMSFFDGKPRSVRIRARCHGVRVLEVTRQMYNRMRVEDSYITTNLLEFVIRSWDDLIRNLSNDNAKLHKQVSDPVSR